MNSNWFKLVMKMTKVKYGKNLLLKGVPIIADRLNAEKAPSPATRKLQSGAKLSLHFRKSDEPPWSAKAVDRILHNEVYIGKLVQGKTRRLDYRSKKKMNVPMRDWTIVDNTHEAIIPAEQFELVQRILETETRRPNDAETVALFAGFLYCGDCGSRLVRRSASYKGKRYIYYQCSGSKQNKGSCTSHNLRDEKLYNIVRNALQMQMKEREIAKKLSAQGTQTPFTRRCQLGYLKNTLRVKDPAWKTVFVTKVLENPIYTGAMVYNRMDVSKFYHGDYYLEELKTIEGK